MPNSQNRSKDQSNIVKPKKRAPKASVSSPNHKKPDVKQNDPLKDIQGTSDEASVQEKKEASGSNSND